MCECFVGKYACMSHACLVLVEARRSPLTGALAVCGPQYGVEK